MLRSAADDPFLARLLPDPARVAVLSASVPSSPTVVLVPGNPGRSGGGGPRGVSRRLLATAGRAATQAVSTLARTRLVDRLRAAADTDGLTGVGNRQALDQALATADDDARRAGTALSVLLLDLDHFKALNDTHGHEAGEDAIRGVGSVLSTGLPAGAFAARYGGEEFCVVLPGTADGARSAELLRERVRGLNGPGSTTVSMGVATLPTHGGDGRELLQAADTALPSAERAERDRVEVARDETGGRLEVTVT